MSEQCPNCQQKAMDPFYEIKAVPSNSCILLSSSQEAMAYPRGDINLGFCSQCGFISNMAFQQKLTEYSGRYEETQGFSGTFNKFHEALAQRMIERYDLRGKHMVEIGCGKGAFLNMLCDLGKNTGTGFDPGYVGDRVDTQTNPNVKFVADYYSEKYASEHGDFICCKMTLEHIHQTADFIQTVYKATGENKETIIFFQIPESIRIFRDCAFEDIYYEHCSYFTAGSVGRLFERCGFELLGTSTEYDDQYLTLEAKPSTSTSNDSQAEDDLAELTGYVNTFPQRCQDKMDSWAHQLTQLTDQGKKVVMWGSGSKGVSFLRTLGDLGKQIEHVVDINPYRQGYYMSGTGQEIVSPEFLKENRPDAIIVMNSIYCDEIGQQLSAMDLHPELMPLI